MKVIIYRENLSYVEKMIYRIVSEYKKALKNNFSIKVLTSDLDVDIYPSKIITSGLYTVSSFEKKIELHVNNDNSKKYIAFIVAHEFAHLLFTNMNDPLHISGIANDESTNFNAIGRILPDGSIYGERLEEMIADYIANYIISRMNYNDKNNQYQKELEKIEFERFIIKKLEYPFGRSLEKCNYIDEKNVNGKNIQKSLTKK